MHETLPWKVFSKKPANSYVKCKPARALAQSIVDLLSRLYRQGGELDCRPPFPLTIGPDAAVVWEMRYLPCDRTARG